jgi:hypothetical protein
VKVVTRGMGDPEVTSLEARAAGAWWGRVVPRWEWGGEGVRLGPGQGARSWFLACTPHYPRRAWPPVGAGSSETCCVACRAWFDVVNTNSHEFCSRFSMYISKSVDTKVVEEITSYDICKGWPGFYNFYLPRMSCQVATFLSAKQFSYTRWPSFLAICTQNLQCCQLWKFCPSKRRKTFILADFAVLKWILENEAKVMAGLHDNRGVDPKFDPSLSTKVCWVD